MVGGHYVPSTGRPRAGFFAFISWAKRVEGSDAFYTAANDEAWAYVSSEAFSAKTGKDWEGYDSAQVEQFLTETARAKITDF